MFGIGGQELILIHLLALIELGPKKLPEKAKTICKAMREFQSATDDFKRQVDLASREDHARTASTPAPEKQDQEAAENRTAMEPQGHGSPAAAQADLDGGEPADGSSQETQARDHESGAEDSPAPAQGEPEVKDQDAPKRGEDAPMAYRPGEIEE